MHSMYWDNDDCGTVPLVVPVCPLTTLQYVSGCGLVSNVGILHVVLLYVHS